MSESTPTRRSLMAAGVSLTAMGMAGCTDQIPFIGDEPLEFGASPVSVPDATLEETEYEEDEIEETVIEETFEAAGQSQEVIVTNWQAEYDKSIDIGGLTGSQDESARAAVMTALSTPQVSVLGQTFNPVADMDSEELAEMLQDRFDGLDDLEHVGDDSTTILGESTTVGELEGEATLAEPGITVDLTLHISEAVESGDDFVIGVGGYPTLLQDDERSHVFTMLEAIEHDE